MGRLIYLKEVTTLGLNQERCVGCGMCVVVCPHAVLRMSNGTAEIINRDACMECGACSRNCPAEALTVQSGVGCAAAVINSLIGRKKESCCNINSSDHSSQSCSDSQRSSCS